MAHNHRWRNMLACVGAMMLVASPARAAMEVKTSNVGHGVKAWYVENSVVPVFHIILSFEGAGTASDPEGKGGRAAFAASMLTEGAGNLDSAAFRHALDEKAITLSASAGDDRLEIHLYGLREHAPRAGELLALALAKPLLAEADQARMKADITSLLNRLEERPGYQTARMINERAFKGHPYANPGYGTLASVASLRGEDVREYLKTYVTRGNVLIAAAGDVDAGLLEDVLEPVLDALPENDAGAVSVTQTNPQGAGETLRKTIANAPQTTILFAAPAIARDDARFYAQYLLNQVLGGSALFSRLGNEVRRDKGLVYSIDTDLDMRRGSASLSGSLTTRNANAQEALMAVKKVLKDMHETGVTTAECSDAKSYVIGSYARKLDSSSDIANMLLSMQVHKLGTDYMRKREKLFGDVSCGDINEIATQILNPANFLFAVGGGTPEANSAQPIAPSPTGHQ